MASSPSVGTSPPPARSRRRSIMGAIIRLIVLLLVVAVAVIFMVNRQVADKALSQLLGIASPAISGATAIDVSLGVTPTPTPPIETTRTRIVVPAGGTQEVRVVLKQGDRLVGLFDADDQVDFSLWILTIPRQRLLRQVQVQGESTFSWTAQESGDYLLQFIAPRTTTVSIAYAIKAN